MRSPLALVVALAWLALGCRGVQPAPVTRYAPSASAFLEVNVDRRGSDYRSFDMATPQPEECRDTCLVEPQCVAFTYANPGVQGPRARCWLKSSAPPVTPDACCVSGVKIGPPSGDVEKSAARTCCVSGVR